MRTGDLGCTIEGVTDMETVTVSWQTLITIAAILTAITTVLGRYNKLYDWVKKQEDQDKAIKGIQEEQALLTYGVLACLKGLSEQGCDGPVSEAISKIEKHINEKAHGAGTSPDVRAKPRDPRGR